MDDNQVQGLPPGLVAEPVQQPQTAAPVQAPSGATATHPTEVEGLPPGLIAEDVHPATQEQAPKPQMPVGSISAAPAAGWGERVREAFANGALGHALEQTMPSVAQELGLTPTETVNSPTYQSNQQQVIAAPNAAVQRQHPIEAGIQEFAGGMTTPENILLTAGTMGEANAAKALGALPNARAIMPKLLTAGFSATQVMSAVKEIPALRQAWAEGDAATVERIMTHMTLNIAAASMGGQHVIGDPKPIFPGMNEAITDFVSKASQGTRDAIRSAVDTTADAKNNVGEQAQAAIDATKEKIFGTPEERAAKAEEIQNQKLQEDINASHADIKQAIPPTKSAMYEDQDIANARPFLEEQNAKKPILSVKDFRDSADKGVDAIEDKVRSYIKANPTDEIDNVVLAHVKAELSGNESEGFADKGLKSLERFNLDGPLTVERADSIREQLNQENTAQMKKNDYSRYDARVSDPRFAAREAAANALRDATYAKMTERGIKGVKELRQQEGSLLKLRDAAEAHILKGEDTMEGSAGVFKGALRHGASRGALSTAGAVAGSTGGPLGAAIGGTVGYLAGAGIEAIPGLQDLTRDEMIERSFGKKVTNGPNYPQIPEGPRIAGALPERAGDRPNVINVPAAPLTTEPEGSAFVASSPVSRATRLGLLLPGPEGTSPDSRDVLNIEPPIYGPKRGIIDYTNAAGENVQETRGFEDISGHNITGPNTARPAIAVGPANDYQMGSARRGTAIVKAEPGTPPRNVVGPTDYSKWYLGGRRVLAGEGGEGPAPKPTRERTVAAGGKGALSSEELKRSEVFVKYSKSGVPTYQAKQPDPSSPLKPGEAILAINKKTGAVRVQDTNSLSDSDAIHKFGRDALKNFGSK